MQQIYWTLLILTHKTFIRIQHFSNMSNSIGILHVRNIPKHRIMLESNILATFWMESNILVTFWMESNISDCSNMSNSNEIQCFINILIHQFLLESIMSSAEILDAPLFLHLGSSWCMKQTCKWISVGLWGSWMKPPAGAKRVSGEGTALSIITLGSCLSLETQVWRS